MKPNRNQNVALLAVKPEQSDGVEFKRRPQLEQPAAATYSFQVWPSGPVTLGAHLQDAWFPQGQGVQQTQGRVSSSACHVGLCVSDILFTERRQFPCHHHSFYVPTRSDCL